MTEQPPSNLDVGRASLLEIERLVSPVVARRDELEPVEKVVGGQSEFNPGSQQLPPGGHGSGSTMFDEIVEPPIDLRLWATQLARNTRLGRGVRIIARNTVGLGWSVIPANKVTEKTPPAELEAIAAEKQRVEDFFNNLHPHLPFEMLAECEVIDEEATGNGYFEIVRTGAGQLEKIYHVPSITMRVLRDGRGFVQLRDGGKKYFKQFGEQRAMDSHTGRFAGEKGFGGDDSSSGTVLPIERRATEIIHFPLYSPLSEFYGIPRFVSAGAAIAGNYHAARRNVAFFQNDAVPRMAVLVSSGQLDPESRKEITQLFQEGKGPDQAHRIIVLQTTSEGAGVDEKNQAKLELQPLTLNSTEDGSFLNYRRANDEEIREALGLSEVYFTSAKLTKASAVVAKSTTDEQEFEPARSLKEKIFNKLLVQGPNGLGAKRVVLRFARPETTDPVELSTVHKAYSEAAVLSSNEIRAALGRDPFPESEQWANLPLPIALAALAGEIAQASRFKTEQVEAPGSPPSGGASGPGGAGDDDAEDDDTPADDAPDDANSSPKGGKREPASKGQDDIQNDDLFVQRAADRVRELPRLIKSSRREESTP